MVEPALVEHARELLAPLGAVRVRRMFGGWGIYIDEIFVAIVAFDRLYLKTDATTRRLHEEAGCEPFVYQAREGRHVALGYWTAPAEAMDSPALMWPWARRALQAAPGARPAGAAPRRRQAPRKSGA